MLISVRYAVAAAVVVVVVVVPVDADSALLLEKTVKVETGTEIGIEIAVVGTGVFPSLLPSV